MLRLLVAALALLAAVPAAKAQTAYPTRPVTVVVPFPPGGLADLSARTLAPSLERVLKQPIVIANRAGAAGAVGLQSVAIANPDGYTLIVALVSISTIPEVDAVFGRSPAYTRDQFVAIARLNADPPMLVVNATQPWKTLNELVEDAKRRAGEIVYTSSGIYGASHVPMEMFLHAAGLKMRHLPFTGGAPAMTAVLGNHAAMWASPPALAAPHLAAGKLRPLATWGQERLAEFRDVPTLKELGYDLEYYLWAGMFAPRAVPADIVRILRQAVAQAVRDPEFKTAMDKIQTPIAYQDGDEFKAWWDADAARLAVAIKRIGRVEGN
ncbi:MAG: tripartite tricarboxylate transporter substrate binding protein [Pseudomonadota bacterium]